MLYGDRQGFDTSSLGDDQTVRLEDDKSYQDLLALGRPSNLFDIVVMDIVNISSRPYQSVFAALSSLCGQSSMVDNIVTNRYYSERKWEGSTVVMDFLKNQYRGVDKCTIVLLGYILMTKFAPGRERYVDALLCGKLYYLRKHRVNPKEGGVK